MPSALEHQLTELNTYNREFDRLQKRGSLRPLDSLMSALDAIDGPVDPQPTRGDT